MLDVVGQQSTQGIFGLNVITKKTFKYTEKHDFFPPPEGIKIQLPGISLCICSLTQLFQDIYNSF